MSKNSKMPCVKVALLTLSAALSSACMFDRTFCTAPERVVEAYRESNEIAFSTCPDTWVKPQCEGLQHWQYSDEGYTIAGWCAGMVRHVQFVPCDQGEGYAIYEDPNLSCRVEYTIEIVE